MKPPATVRVTVDVAVDPDTAFAVFTDEIDEWYHRGPHTFANPARALAIRIEPFIGGRLLEVYDLATGEGRAMGRVTVWDPPRRLVVLDARGTEMDVRFEAGASGTRVTLEHRGLEKLPPDAAEHHARFGWRLVFAWYEERMHELYAPARAAI